MTIPEAIEELTFPDDIILINVTPEFQKAAKMGIGALELELEARVDLGPGEYALLPGETKE